MNIGDTILPSDCSDNCVNLLPIPFTVYKALVHYYMNPGEIFFYWFIILCFPILSRKLELQVFAEEDVLFVIIDLYNHVDF